MICIGCSEREALPGFSLCEVCQVDAPRSRVLLPRPPGDFVLQSLLTFERRGERSFIGTPQRPFRPKGLMLWDVGLLSVEAAIIGTYPQLVVAFGKVPARWFAVQQSFDQVVKALAAGNDAAGWGTWHDVHPGMLVRLEFDGPVDRVQALMWGLST